MFYSLADLTAKFNNLDQDKQNQVFSELHSNIDIYKQLAPQLPLVKYAAYGEAAVPADQHGPIITAFKQWRADQQGE